VDFWSDHGPSRGRIQVEQVIDLIDSDTRAGVITKGVWVGADDKPLLRETRQTWVYPLDRKEWLLVLDLALGATSGDVVFESNGFGPIGVRMAKWIAVHFGGGRIRNSERAEGEQAIFRKPARWVDYSGEVASNVVEGLTLFDHPGNPGHPSPFHVREDGWMGAMLSTERNTIASRLKPLHLRYGVYVHSGAPSASEIDRRWEHFANLDLNPPYGPPKSERDCLHGGHRQFNMPRSFASTQHCLDYVRTPKR
jgi:hypothetical protein